MVLSDSHLLISFTEYFWIMFYTYLQSPTFVR